MALKMADWKIMCVLAVLGMALAGCAPAASPAPAPSKASASPQAPKPTAVASPAATPKPSAEQPGYGGILNRSIRSEIPHYDLHTSSSGIYLYPISPAYNGLVQYDPSNPGKVIADLAEKWSVSGDGLEYTFALRKGVKWHDGSPLTTGDVLLSLERLRKHPHTGSGLTALKNVLGPDDGTVKIVLNYPSTALINYLALSWSAIMPRHIIDRKGGMKSDIIGTGAFKFKRFESGSYIELERNPGFFIQERPYLDGIRTYFIPSEDTAIAALKTGRIDMTITGISDSGAMRIRETFKEGTAAQFKGGQWRAVYLPVDKSPWKDIRVRRAVHLAVDRQAGIKVLMGGVADLGSQIPEVLGGIPVADLMKRPGYRQPKDADIAEARRLLAEAGYASGFKTTMLYRKGSEYESQAVFLADQLRKLDIEVALKTVDDATFYDIRDKRNYETFSHRRPMSVNEPDDILMKEYKTGASDNWSNLSDAELDRLIDLQSREQDPEKRKAIVRQANERIEELAVSVMLSWAGYWRTWGPRVKGYVLPGQLYDDEKFVAVWLAR
ncbi:MAG: ABC transporter substrate-binding protein [Chloroflexi bacterium]|nr:ABC transporter substrate-binding protein [Chloroflexota bacterium]